MKKIIIVLLLGSLNSFCQQQFEFNKEGLKDYVVLNLDNKAKSELYTKTINWIKETYKKPDEVINSKIENEKIFIEGINVSSLHIGGGSGMNAKYNIEISFKDGKIKFNPTRLEYYTKQYGWNDIYINKNAKRYYNRKGKVRGLYKKLVVDIPNLFNDLSKNMENYILGKNKIEQDW